MSNTSCYADARAARRAIDLALPAIEAAVAKPEVSGAGFLHIVVMDPARTPADCRFEEAILMEHSIGDRRRWDADYAAFALAKARTSWQHGEDGCRVQAHQAHRLKPGDSILWGSVCLDGIVVAASGAHPWWDEAFALAVAANLRALAKAAHAAALAEGQWTAGAPQSD